MNRHEEYLTLFPTRKVFNAKGEPTQAYLDWLESQKSLLMQTFEADEARRQKELNQWYKDERSAYDQKVKANRKATPDPIFAEVDEKSHPKRVNKWLEA